jgi:hypothetical protein
MAQQAVRVMSGLPARTIYQLSSHYAHGSELNLFLVTDYSIPLYRELRRKLKEMGYTFKEVDDNRREYVWRLLVHDNGHKVHVVTKRDATEVKCERLIVKVEPLATREWVCPDDPDYEEKKALSARLERALGS